MPKVGILEYDPCPGIKIKLSVYYSSRNGRFSITIPDNDYAESFVTAVQSAINDGGLADGTGMTDNSSSSRRVVFALTENSLRVLLINSKKYFRQSVAVETEVIVIATKVKGDFYLPNRHKLDPFMERSGFSDRDGVSYQLTMGCYRKTVTSAGGEVLRTDYNWSSHSQHMKYGRNAGLPPYELTERINDGDPGIREFPYSRELEKQLSAWFDQQLETIYNLCVFNPELEAKLVQMQMTAVSEKKTASRTKKAKDTK